VYDAVSRKTYLVVASLFAIFLASSAMALPLGNVQRTISGIHDDSGNLACVDGSESAFQSDFVWRSQVDVAVSTSACAVVVEVIDWRSWEERTQGRAYIPLVSVTLLAGENASLTVPETGFRFFVLFRASSPFAPSTVTTLVALWRFSYVEPDPLATAASLFLLLAGVVAVFLAILRVVKEVPAYEVGAGIAAAASFSYAIMGHALSTTSLLVVGGGADLFVSSMVGSSVLAGLSIFLLTLRQLHARPLDVQIATSVVLYLGAGLAALAIAAVMAHWGGPPPILVPIWPSGVVFMLLAETVWDRPFLGTLFWLAKVLAAMLSIGLLAYASRYDHFGLEKTGARAG
jgi:hypothetical protein